MVRPYRDVVVGRDIARLVNVDAVEVQSRRGIDQRTHLGLQRAIVRCSTTALSVAIAISAGVGKGRRQMLLYFDWPIHLLIAVKIG